MDTARFQMEYPYDSLSLSLSLSPLPRFSSLSPTLARPCPVKTPRVLTSPFRLRGHASERPGKRGEKRRVRRDLFAGAAAAASMEVHQSSDSGGGGPDLSLDDLAPQKGASPRLHIAADAVARRCSQCGNVF